MAKLSFHLPRYDDPINELQDRVLFGLHMQDEILSLFPPREIVHRGITRLVSEPNILDRSMKSHHAKESIEPAMFLQMDVLKFRDYILRLTKSLLDQQKRHTVLTPATDGGKGSPTARMLSIIGKAYCRGKVARVRSWQRPATADLNVAREAMEMNAFGACAKRYHPSSARAKGDASSTCRAKPCRSQVWARGRPPTACRRRRSTP